MDHRIVNELEPPSVEEGSIVEISSISRPTEEPPQRETLRGNLASWLLAGFLFQVAAVLLAAIFYPAKIDDLLKVLNATLTPTVAILGAVIGFYFGSRPKADGP